MGKRKKVASPKLGTPSRPALWKQIADAAAVPVEAAPKELPVIYYRAVAWGRWMGPWQPHKANAEKDAERAGNGSRDEHTRIFYLAPGASIMSLRGPVIGR